MPAAFEPVFRADAKPGRKPLKSLGPDAKLALKWAKPPKAYGMT